MLYMHLHLHLYLYALNVAAMAMMMTTIILRHHEKTTERGGSTAKGILKDTWLHSIDQRISVIFVSLVFQMRKRKGCILLISIMIFHVSFGVLDIRLLNCFMRINCNIVKEVLNVNDAMRDLMIWFLVNVMNYQSMVDLG